MPKKKGGKKGKGPKGKSRLRVCGLSKVVNADLKLTPNAGYDGGEDGFIGDKDDLMREVGFIPLPFHGLPNSVAATYIAHKHMHARMRTC